MLRFAPSPNGPLHKGHALSALCNERMARALGVALTLRMEDIDTTRCKPAFEAAIVADLDWLGVAWRGPVVRQAEHFGRYRAVVDALAQEGLVYASHVTRRELADAAHTLNLPRDPDGAPRLTRTMVLGSPRELARRAAEGEPAAMRLDMAEALRRVGPVEWCEIDADGARARTVPGDAMAWGDVVLARKEVPTSYHLSVVVDDGAQGITHVVRGADLYAATAVHRVLQKLLGLPAPAYRHHALVLGSDGRKLSKSNGAQSLAALREAGVSAASLRAELGELCV